MVDYVSAYTGAEIDAGIALANKQVFGWQNYQDTATAVTPIQLTVAGQWYDLTNNGLGPLSSTAAAYPGHGNIYDTGTNTIDFSDLAILDKVVIRHDVQFTTAGPNHRVDLRMVFGPGYIFSIPLDYETYKSSVSGESGRLFGESPFYMFNTDTQGNPAKFQAKSDSTGDSVIVNGWNIETWPLLR